MHLVACLVCISVCVTKITFVQTVCAEEKLVDHTQVSLIVDMFLPPKGICMHNSMFSMCNVSQAILIADVFMQLLGTILRMCKRSCVQLLV